MEIDSGAMPFVWLSWDTVEVLVGDILEEEEPSVCRSTI
jgi:hypothetical protein